MVLKFLPALMQLLYCLPEVQEPFNWFTDFLQKELFLVLLLSQCLCGGEELLGLPILLSC